MKAPRCQRNCLNCKDLFLPDYRGGERQRFCLKPECRKARKRESQLALVQRTRTFTSPSFVADHIIEPGALVAQWLDPQDEISKSLRALLPANVRETLFTDAGMEVGPKTPLALARALNKLAKGPSLYDPTRFADRILSPESLALKGRELTDKQLAQFNRLLLRDAFAEQISTAPKAETVWLVTSREPGQMGPEELLEHNREYWGIENGAHQRLDCSAMEDRLRVRNKNAATVLGLLRRMSLSLFMAWAKTQHSQRDRTYPTWRAWHAGNRRRIIRQITDSAPAR